MYTLTQITFGNKNMLDKENSKIGQYKSLKFHVSIARWLLNQVTFL